MNEEDIAWRACGQCGEKIIPRGVEWPHWVNGACVCDGCMMKINLKAVSSPNVTVSVQPEWCRKLTLQQQSVLLLGARGPDGIPKTHPCKEIQRAYRGCVLVAAKFGRQLHWGEKADTFMSLDVFASTERWTIACEAFFDTIDELPHHYLMHLLHGVEILGFKHPYNIIRERWFGLYEEMVDDLHLVIEDEEAMDRRLADWDRKFWGE